MARIEQEARALTIRPDGPRLDAAAAIALKAAVVGALAGEAVGRPRVTIVDAGGLEFVDSTGLGALVGILKMMDSEGVMAIAGANGGLRRLLETTGLDRVFCLYATVAEAEAALRPVAD